MTDALIERLEARLAYKGIRGVEEELMHEAAQALKAKDAALAAKDAEIAELREALGFYADEANWKVTIAEVEPHDGMRSLQCSSGPAKHDKGEVARKALGGSDND